MRIFQANQEDWPHDSVVSYLNHEKENISQVRDRIDNAIFETQEILRAEKAE